VGTGGGSSVKCGAVINPSFISFNTSAGNTSVLGFGTNATSNAGVSGAGSITNSGGGTLIMTNSANSYMGDTVSSAGTLALAGTLGGNVFVTAGKLDAGGYVAGAATTGTLNVGGNLTTGSGVYIQAALNKSLSVSNGQINVTGTTTIGAGNVLRLLNYGPLPNVGDTFTIFGNASSWASLGTLTIESPGITFINNLTTSGSVTVGAVAAAGSNKVAGQRIGSSFGVTWPGIWSGLYLQSQTDTNSSGLKGGGNWVTLPGSDMITGVTNVFGLPTFGTYYRLSPQ
jgi:hypothetical protein